VPKLDAIVRRLGPSQPGSQHSIEADLSRLLVDSLKERKDGDSERFGALLDAISSASQRMELAAKSASDGTVGSLSQFSAAVANAFDGIRRAIMCLESAHKESIATVKKDVMNAVSVAIKGIPQPVVNVDGPDLDAITDKVVSAFPSMDIASIVRAEVDRAIGELKEDEKPKEWVFEVEREGFSDRIKRIVAKVSNED